MANKYISQGNTYDGDGTTLADATSNGGVGAWNDFKASVAGSPAYGTLAKGDVVYIRSEKSSVNLTQTLTAKLIFMSGDYDNPITYVFDDGTIWTGDNGEFQLVTGSAQVVNFADWTVIAGQDSLRIEQTGTPSGYLAWIEGDNGHCSGVYFKTPKTSSRSAWLTSESNKTMTYHDCTFEIRSMYSSAGYEYCFAIKQYSSMYLYNCTIDFSDIHTQRNTGIFYNQNYGSFCFVRGLKVTGDWAGLCICTSSTSANYTKLFQCQNVDSDGNLSFRDYRFTTDFGTKMYSPTISSGLNGKPFDFEHQHELGMESKWREGSSYPVLNAVLPDGTTKWSILNYPIFGGPGRFLRLPELNEFFEGTPATRKITLEMLISTNYTTPKKHQFWMDVHYFDSNGIPRYESTYDFDANVGSSIASWDTTTYLTQGHSKYKLELTTVQSIKQYSWITVVLNCAIKAPSANDFFFVCPDFKVEAP